MIGNVRSKTSINATISSNSVLRGSLGSSTILGDIKIGTVQIMMKAQAKTVTPSTSQQVVMPDSPTYNCLSQVTVSAIPYTETDNAAGGKTVTIAA